MLFLKGNKEMKKILCILLIGVFLCVSCAVHQTPEIIDPSEPLVMNFEKEPPPPVRRSSKNSVAYPVSECIVEGTNKKVGPGIIISQDMARDIAIERVDHEKLRDVYILDQKIMNNERLVYQRLMQDADEEIDDLREKTRRSWFEKHGAKVTLVIGFVTGAALTVGIAAALDAALGDKK
jgi:hypothetical protein